MTAGYPTALVVGRTGSGFPIVDPSGEVALKVAGTGSVGDREAGGVDQQGVSSLTKVVGCSCLHRTWKLLAFRVLSERETTANAPGFVAVEEGW